MDVTCDYCGKPAALVTGEDIYPHRPDLFHKKFWDCFDCKAYVGCHPPAKSNGKGGQGDGTVPLGRLANAELRQWKSKAHANFDPIWQNGGRSSRKNAYQWLAKKLGIAFDDCHIGMFDVDTCKRVVQICQNRTVASIIREKSA